MINILVAILSKTPKPETMESVFGLHVPNDSKLSIKFFDGHKTDMYNKIAQEVIDSYDYAFFVDSNVKFEPDTLVKLFDFNVDIISATIPQKLSDKYLLEMFNENGEALRFEDIFKEPLSQAKAIPLVCCLIKKTVFQTITAPHFVDMEGIPSDYRFFVRANVEYNYALNFNAFVQCSRIGDYEFKIKHMSYEEARFRELYMQDLLPVSHREYLAKLNSEGYKPKVIYDIGACVLHWTKKIKETVWNDSQYFCFEAMEETEFLYKEFGVDGYHNGVLTYVDNIPLDFYKSIYSPGGNSYYLENQQISGGNYYGDGNKFRVRGMTLDTVRRFNNFPLPNLIKMDVQGAELDIIRGATKCLEHADDLILELQDVDYNMGAPKSKDVIDYLREIGYELVGTGPFCLGAFDADYHFKRVK